MTVIEFPGRLARIGEIRFAAGPTESVLDVVYYLQVKHSLPAGRCVPVTTSVIDLTRTPEQLLEAMNDTTRYEIRRAEKRDALAYHSDRFPTRESIASFVDFFARFADRRGLSRASDRVLEAYARSGCLDLSRVSAQTGEVLGWHAHFIDCGRARLLHSANTRSDAGDNERRNLLGRANRWHHWHDFLRLRELGLKEFDFGGIRIDDEDPDQSRIRDFKEKFGGVREAGFNCEVPLTWRGSFYAFVRRLRGRG